MERRLCEQEVRLNSDGEKNKITGTAVVFYRDGDKGTEYDLAGYGMPGVKERIMPGALKRVLGRSQGGTLDRNQDVYAAVNHSPDLVFARTTAGTLKLSVDDQGLHYEATPADTTVGRDAIENARAGNFGGSSFAFSVAKGGDKWTRDANGVEIREVHRIDKLVDISPVVSPAYAATSVNARSAEECRASYDAWKQEEETRYDSPCPKGKKMVNGKCVDRKIDFSIMSKRHILEIIEDEDTYTIVFAKPMDEDPIEEEQPVEEDVVEEDEEAAHRSFVARLKNIEATI